VVLIVTITRSWRRWKPARPRRRTSSRGCYG